MSDSDKLKSYKTVLDMIESYRVSCVVAAAVRLNVFEKIGSSEIGVEELALAISADAGALRRFIRALRALGLAEQRQSDLVSLTLLGKTLLQEESSLGARSLLTAKQYLPVWESLHLSVLSGDRAIEEVLGMDAWAHRQSDEELGRWFDRVMTEDQARSENLPLKAKDFGTGKRIIDIGGGRGHVIAELLARHPQNRGVLFDQPHVVAGAGEILAAARVEDRCEIAAGSFFESIPAGGDFYILQHILHDWNDARCIDILKNLRDAMTRSSLVLIVEHLSDGDRAVSDSLALAMLDLHVMVTLGGRERSRLEFETLLDSAGLQITHCRPTQSSLHLLEARIR